LKEAFRKNNKKQMRGEDFKIEGIKRRRNG